MTNEEQLKALLQTCLDETGCYLVSMQMRPGNLYKIYVDHDMGLTLEQSVRINRRLRGLVDEAGLYPEGDYSLEVSSPGIDSPIRLHRQYMRHLNRLLEVSFHDAEKAPVMGRLLAVTDEAVRLMPERKRSARRVKETTEPVAMDIPFAEIEKAIVQIEF
mgnify:FL=1